MVPLARSGKIASKSFILSFTDEKTTALQQIMSMNNGLQGAEKVVRSKILVRS